MCTGLLNLLAAINISASPKMKGKERARIKNKTQINKFIPSLVA